VSGYTEKSCPSCGQQLRFPDDVGGVVMACPSCGNRFYSDFKFGTGSGPARLRSTASVLQVPGIWFKRFRRRFFS
jgi:DNA-directed RNA polymerase subunit RPC12/RpoP